MRRDHNITQKVLSSLLVISFLSFSVFAEYIQGIPTCKSAKGKWCWAGACESILKYYDKDLNKSQAEIAKVITTQNRAATLEEIEKCLVENGKDVGLEVTHIPNTLSWEEVKEQSDLKQPFIFYIKWNSGNYHCEVFAGYDKDESKLKFIDPAHGGIITYRAYRNSFNVS